MEQFVGLDVSQQMTHVCIIGSDGKTVWQGKCLSTPEAIAEVIKSKAPEVARIGLESGPLSTWHWHALKDMGCHSAARTRRKGKRRPLGNVHRVWTTLFSVERAFLQLTLPNI